MPAQIENLTIGQIKTHAPDWKLSDVGRALLAEMARGDQCRAGAIEALLHSQLERIATVLLDADPKKKNDTAGLEVLGRFKAVTGVLVLGDSAVFDQHWKAVSAAPQAVYVEGDPAELAELFTLMQKSFPIERLADGTWRIERANETEASVCASQIVQMAVSKKWNTVRAFPRPLYAGRSMAQDAARGQGVGFAARGGIQVGSKNVPVGEMVTVYKDPSGRLVVE